MAEICIDIEIYCECGHRLDAKAQGIKPYGSSQQIDVDSCENCGQKNYDKGYKTAEMDYEL